jgi:hypothetical protein
MTSGILGGVTGYVFWLVLFGKLIMPWPPQKCLIQEQS